MIILRDLYTQVIHQCIVSSGITLGTTIIQYEVKSYTDTRNLGSIKSYIVNCTQRLIFPNLTPYIKGSGPVTNFTNYPALLSNAIIVADPNNVLSEINVVDYSPRTLNTAVSTSQNQGQSESASTSHQYSSGASNSQTNSYSVSENIGFFGDLPMGGVTAGYSYSDTQSQFSSQSQGTSKDRGTQLSNSSSMTIKDWGSYATLDASNASPTWVWGQEYPWNTILFKATDESGNVLLPQFVQQRLWDGHVVYPPSELSLFGIDFVAKVSWQITPARPLMGNETLNFNHALTYGAGSHGVSNGNLTANLNVYAPIQVVSHALDLPVLALDPLSDNSNKPAVVGFVSSKFDVAPDAQGAQFAITSDTNDLLVRGSGFNGILTTDFKAGTVQMTLYFKLTDAISNIGLHIKHWTANNSAVQIALVVNNNSSAILTRFVDAPETGSGTDNITVIALRNRDMASVDYCDLLQPGLNTITLTATPVENNPNAAWQILAMAIG